MEELARYAHGFFGAIFEEYVKRLNELTGYTGENSVDTFMDEENEKYKLRCFPVPVPADSHIAKTNRVIGLPNDPSVAIFLLMEIDIGEFEFKLNLTGDFIEYLEARNISEAYESIGTCAAICVQVQEGVWKDFMNDYENRES